MQSRFKIDHYESRAAPFGLYRRAKGGWREKWLLVDNFQTLDECRALYQRIKDLPEYMD